jgi:DNA polymerase III subunit delta'
VIFPEVLGQDRARALLARLLQSGRLPHAFLFHGPEGVGKGLVARLFANSLICIEPGADGSGCGTCTACRKAAHGNHPDLLLVTRLPKKDKQAAADVDDDDEDADADDAPSSKGAELRPFIIVQQIRDLNRHASFAPREGKRRVFIVEPADRMHAESQNALLKTLEEPPGQAVIVLVASRPHVLLPTVRSRCFQIGFGAIPPDELARGLVSRGMPADEAKARAALAEGRPGRAMSLDLPALAKRRDQVLAALQALAESPRAAAQLGDYAELLLGESEADLSEGFDLVMALLRDAARIASGRGTILHADLSRRVEALSRSLGAERATELVALVDRVRQDLRLNINKTLACETILAAVAGGPVAVLV